MKNFKNQSVKEESLNRIINTGYILGISAFALVIIFIAFFSN